VTDTPLVSARGLKKRFRVGPSEISILKGIDLDIAKGEMLSIVGASGVGKSTLLHLLGALDRPTEGTVLYGSEDIFGMDDGRLASFRNANIGFVFQFHHLLPEFTALENVFLPAMISGKNTAAFEARAKEILAEVGLSERLNHRPGELSGGEQQRVAIARALMTGPSIILADEPTGNLDTQTAESVHDLLERLNKEKGLTTVVVTHNERLAGRADRIIRMVDGLIV
jgi:lipoprotein-releasing system ATP-binding protein